MEKRLNQLYLGLGSNLGDKIENIEQALVLIHAEIGVITKKSTYYFSQPQGFVSENDFVNSVVKVATYFSPFEVLNAIERMEKELGRTSKSNGFFQDRLIDIDILYYNNEIIRTDFLVIPHPFIFQRDFVHVPLMEILDDLTLIELRH
jgi:2-amino-4-hydroxy-6-hydroxymethyldihydropteridine diphosphokinase